jgi:hypothetical protein
MNAFRIALALSILLLTGAFYPSHSYNYFVLLKWVVFGTSVWGMIRAADTKSTPAIWIFVASAIIHNPIMKFRFERETWLGVDGITALIFIVLMFRMYKSPNEN